MRTVVDVQVISEGVSLADSAAYVAAAVRQLLEDGERRRVTSVLVSSRELPEEAR